MDDCEDCICMLTHTGQCYCDHVGGKHLNPHIMKKKTTLDTLLESRIGNLSNDDKESLIRILDALEESASKHPAFASGSVMYASNIVAEEAGELARACNQFCYEDGEEANMIEEATHVGAVAIRMVTMLHQLMMPVPPKSVANDDTKELIHTIISWEKNLAEYETLENKLRARFKIQKHK